MSGTGFTAPGKNLQTMTTKLKENVAISESGFVFDPATGDSFSMNPIGVEIMNMLQAGNSQEEIFAHILSKFDVEKDVFEQNYYDFMGMLRQFNLLDNDA